MVQRMLGKNKRKEMHGMWFTTTTFPSDVHFTYSYERLIPPVEESPRQFHALLHGVPSEVGIWGPEWYEDLFGGPGDSTED